MEEGDSDISARWPGQQVAKHQEEIIDIRRKLEEAEAREDVYRESKEAIW